MVATQEASAGPTIRQTTGPASRRYDCCIGTCRWRDEFYSHDRDCRALASLVMTSHDLPTCDPQDMFLLDDIRRGEA